jgi:organic hydroperoxide reductase OsmC/OhrA
VQIVQTKDNLDHPDAFAVALAACYRIARERARLVHARQADARIVSENTQASSCSIEPPTDTNIRNNLDLYPPLQVRAGANE